MQHTGHSSPLLDIFLFLSLWNNITQAVLRLCLWGCNFRKRVKKSSWVAFLVNSCALTGAWLQLGGASRYFGYKHNVIFAILNQIGLLRHMYDTTLAVWKSCFSSVFCVYVYLFIYLNVGVHDCHGLLLSGIIFIHETPEWLHGLENITWASINEVVSSK